MHQDIKLPKSIQAALAITLLAILVSACATIPVEDRARIRAEVNQRADETIEALVAKDPELQKSVDSSVGHFVGRVSATKVPIVGGGSGLGVLYDKENATRTYMNVNRFDVGVGVGGGTYRVLILFQNREVLEQFRSGVWKSGVGAETAAGETSAAAISSAGEGVTIHTLSEAGAAAVVTARLIRLSVNGDLTDSGVSAVSIPNTGFTVADQQGEDAPRIWDHKLPFLAQKVIDQGYDLPLPYGLGLTYANVEQDMLLDNLEVGINGNDKEPFEFVSFDNASSENDSAQLKLETWLFPFMNVFATLGKIDGKAPLDVLIDGNGMLDQLGISCPPAPPPQNPLCGVLEDQTFTLPIEAKFKGTTYGLGTVLAGGWNNWFVSVPIVFTYADMDDKDTDGVAITFTPRFGKVFNLGRRGNLALFAGGNYLNTDLTITGTVTTPNGLLVIDYTIDQQNKDEWNLLLGGNWDINKRWSWSAEYESFIGSRDAFVTSVTRRF